MSCRWRVILVFVLIYIGRIASGNEITLNLSTASETPEGLDAGLNGVEQILVSSASNGKNSPTTVPTTPTTGVNKSSSSGTLKVLATMPDEEASSTTIETKTDSQSVENGPTESNTTVQNNIPRPTRTTKVQINDASSATIETSTDSQSVESGSTESNPMVQNNLLPLIVHPATVQDKGSRSSTIDTYLQSMEIKTTTSDDLNHATETDSHVPMNFRTTSLHRTNRNHSTVRTSGNLNATNRSQNEKMSTVAPAAGISASTIPETLTTTTTSLTETTTETTLPATTDELTADSTTDNTSSPSSTDDTTSSTTDGTTDVTGSSTSTTTTDVTNDSTSTATTDVTNDSTSTTTTDVTNDSTSTATTDVTSSSTSTATTNVTDDSTSTGTTNVTDDSTSTGTTNVTDDSTSNGTTDVTDDSTSNGTTNVTDDSTSTGTTNVTDDSTSTTTTNVTDDSTSNGTTDVTDDTTSNGTTNVTDDTTSNGTTNVTDDSTSTTTTDVTSSSTSTGTTDNSTTTDPTTESSTSLTTPPQTTTTTRSTTTSTPLEVTTALPPPDPHTVEIVAGILGVLLFAGLLASAAVMYRRGKLPWNPKNSNASVRPLPILLSKFENHCNELLETQGRLGSEFQLLQALSVDISDTNTFTAAQLPDNKKKNRYTNILPYDATRVILPVVNDDPSSDYINASFVKGFSNTFEYIATQGPKEETISDFWRMVHEHDVRVIVMVTNWEESGKPKCDHYLPKLRDQIYHGDIVVRCGTELVFPVYTQRTIVLHHDSKKRNVAHLHFNEWPDFGCPDSTESMLQFCRTLRHQVSLYDSGKVLVHCSAGVGRTGTLIAVDILLQQIQESKKVDVFGTVFKLRKHRTNMVQTKGQYEYIYKCIRDAVKDPTFLKSDASPASSLEPIYENVPTTLTTFLYEKVPHKVAKSNSSESECEL